tara:strand:+ start:129 stop:278 length:150 start_codon:yes stop_codon:yes gene_type:complete
VVVEEEQHKDLMVQVKMVDLAVVLVTEDQQDQTLVVLPHHQLKDILVEQ